MIDLIHVRKVFNAGKPNEFTAIQGVNLKIVPRNVTVFKGPSGSGKTTLLSLIGCMARPTAGRIYLLEKESDQPSGEISHRSPEKNLRVYFPAIQSGEGNLGPGKCNASRLSRW